MLCKKIGIPNVQHPKHRYKGNVIHLLYGQGGYKHKIFTEAQIKERQKQQQNKYNKSEKGRLTNKEKCKRYYQRNKLFIC